MVGASGGRNQLEAVMAADVDALIVGEANEWEAPEYFRDAAFQKTPSALFVVGHEPSEEAGMARLAEWLGERFPDIPILHRSSGDPLRVI
jgi:putative NIF3 family GTP cyclohydrolase 1 type 2